MAFAISPDHTTESFKGELSTDEKIEVFISRVRGWQITPALAMQEKKIPHRGFAQLLIVVSYFEMLGKYMAGFIGEGKSGAFFKEGFLYTFPDLPDDEKALLDTFYRNIRNGLYHVGMTRPNVLIFDGIPGSFGFHEESGALVISPDRFVEDILIRFEHFASELRNPENQELRINFVARFDSDNAFQQ
jgi:hypothetical protein